MDRLQSLKIIDLEHEEPRQGCEPLEVRPIMLHAWPWHATHFQHSEAAEAGQCMQVRPFNVSVELKLGQSWCTHGYMPDVDMHARQNQHLQTGH